jgi:hypothetical protein
MPRGEACVAAAGRLDGRRRTHPERLLVDATAKRPAGADRKPKATRNRRSPCVDYYERTVVEAGEAPREEDTASGPIDPSGREGEFVVRRSGRPGPAASCARARLFDRSARAVRRPAGALLCIPFLLRRTRPQPAQPPPHPRAATGGSNATPKPSPNAPDSPRSPANTPALAASPSTPQTPSPPTAEASH